MLHYVTNVPLCHIHRIEWACLPFNHNPSLVVSRWISSGISMCAVRVCVCMACHIYVDTVAILHVNRGWGLHA